MCNPIHEALDAASSISFHTKALSVEYWPHKYGFDGFWESLFEKLALSGKDVEQWTEPGQKSGDKVTKTWWY
jgi:hypothetical protein